jgi:glyoxalase family protein
MQILGLHHVTAVAGDLTVNLRFYTEVLGLRLVKRTVNFDDPSSYHLYFGDTLGTPGSALTFFYWTDQPRARPGPGQVTAIAWSIATPALPFWRTRLAQHGLAFTEQTRLGEPVLAFADPDGLRLELVGAAEPDPRAAWAHPEIPSAHGLLGFHHVTLTLHPADATRAATLLTDSMGARAVAAPSAAPRVRYAFAGGGPGAYVDIVTVSATTTGGHPGAGSVHHVAFRVADARAQEHAAEAWRSAGLQVSPVRDRQYFQAIYVRGPGGVLLEISTDGPGFTVDEPAASLGTALHLPPEYEPHRTRITAALPPLPTGTP